MRYEITFPYENLGWCLARPWAVGQFMLNDNMHYENFACIWREVGVIDGPSHGSLIDP